MHSSHGHPVWSGEGHREVPSRDQAPHPFPGCPGNIADSHACHAYFLCCASIAYYPVTHPSSHLFISLTPSLSLCHAPSFVILHLGNVDQFLRKPTGWPFFFWPGKLSNSASLVRRTCMATVHTLQCPGGGGGGGCSQPHTASPVNAFLPPNLHLQLGTVEDGVVDREHGCNGEDPHIWSGEGIEETLVRIEGITDILHRCHG